MANRDTPNGFRVAQGIGSQHVYKMFRVDSASTTGTLIMVGDVIDLDGSGAIRAAADAGVSVAGIAVAVYDSNGVPCGAPNSSVSTKYLTTSTSGFVLVALAIPGAVFIAQTQSGQTSTNDDVGLTTDHIATAGDTTVASSKMELTYSGGGLQFRIIGLNEEPGNAWGEHSDLQVVFNESAFGVSGAASV